MKPPQTSRIPILSVILLYSTVLAISLAGIATPSYAQTGPYSDALLPAIRRAATIVPGDPPKSLHVLTFNRGKSPVSEAVENAPSDSIAVAYVVFQIVYSHGWIMVDAGMDKELIDAGEEFSQERYDRAQLALRDARMVVVTHEHHDHVAGVIRSPYLSEIERKTLLNRAQVQTLLDHPNKPAIKLDRERAARYLVVDYDLLLPIAPGVVLIKAAGHTPGSQMVYVRLASGQEILLAGDVAWLMLGIEKRLQKPESASKSLGEDREAIRPQLEWLHGLAAQKVIVVVCHDAPLFATLIRRGILKDDLDLRSP